jgi:hypothetical protein
MKKVQPILKSIGQDLLSQVASALIISEEDGEEDDESIRAAEEEQLKPILTAHGLQITQQSRTKRDGNCWASALAYGINQLLGHDLTPTDVRHTTVMTLLNNQKQFENFFSPTFPPIDDDTESFYIQECDYFLTSGRWFSERSNIHDLLIPAFSFGAGVSTMVFDSDGTLSKHGVIDDLSRTIHIARLVKPVGKEHYEALDVVILKFNYCVPLSKS